MSSWVPSGGRLTGFSSVDTLLEDVYNAATRATNWDHLEIRGPDINCLTATFKEMIGDAAESGDFTNVLAPRRLFVM